MTDSESVEVQLDVSSEEPKVDSSSIYRITLSDPDEEGNTMMRRCLLRASSPGEALKQSHEKLKETEDEWDFCFAKEEWFSAPPDESLVTEEEDASLTDRAYTILQHSRRLTQEDWEVLARVIQTRDFRDSHRVVIERLVEPKQAEEEETAEEIAGMLESSLNLNVETGEEREHETDDEDEDEDYDSIC
jgi:hypothetical protein